MQALKWTGYHDRGCPAVCLPVYPYDRSTRLIVYPCHHTTTSLRLSFRPSVRLSVSPSMRNL